MGISGKIRIKEIIFRDDMTYAKCVVEKGIYIPGSYMDIINKSGKSLGDHVMYECLGTDGSELHFEVSEGEEFIGLISYDSEEEYNSALSEEPEETITAGFILQNYSGDDDDDDSDICF